MGERRLEVSVHQRLDAVGFVIVVRETDGDKTRTVKFPVGTYDEATALSASIQSLAAVPGGVDALFSDEGWERSD
jgi:hypothetical protein